MTWLSLSLVCLISVCTVRNYHGQQQHTHPGTYFHFDGSCIKSHHFSFQNKYIHVQDTETHNGTDTCHTIWNEYHLQQPSTQTNATLSRVDGGIGHISKWTKCQAMTCAVKWPSWMMVHATWHSGHHQSCTVTVTKTGSSYHRQQRTRRPLVVWPRHQKR